MKAPKKQYIDLITAQTILDAMPEVAYVFNKEKELVLWNKNTEKVLGYTEDELYLKNVFDFVEESTIEENSTAFKNLFSKKEQQVIQQNLLTKTGGKIPILDTANYATIEGEEYLIGLAIDITQLRKTEEELQNALVELNKLKEQLQVENVYLREEYKGSYNYDDIVGDSASTKRSRTRIEQVSPTGSTVLITGETGTQKELVARVIHNKSTRKNKPFIMADCSNSSEQWVESKLFGYEKGAFPTALQKRVGKIEMANTGTLFLYEIGELSMELQSRLFRVLTKGTFERIGSSKVKKVDCRIIASTRHDLNALVHKGLFREDLYYELNVYSIPISPLRDRIDDIPLLAHHFLQAYNKELGKTVDRISKKTLKELQQYPWPGNELELENMIERGVIISNRKLLRIEPFFMRRNNVLDLGLLPLAEFERNYILHVLEYTSWRVEGFKGAAKVLDMHPETLRSRMRKLNIKRPLD